MLVERNVWVIDLIVLLLRLMGAVFRQSQVIVAPSANFRHYPFDTALLFPILLRFIDNVRNRTTFVTSGDWVPTIR